MSIYGNPMSGVSAMSQSDDVKKTSAPLRLFKATDRFNIKGRGEVWAAPCPFEWNKDDGVLAAWKGEWLISHPEADHTKTYEVTAVESWCISHIREGAPVGIMVKEIIDAE